MSILQNALENGQFGVTAEMAPPKGYDFTEQMEAAEVLRGKVHSINVTDMQSACLKASSIGLCVKLKLAGLEPVLPQKQASAQSAPRPAPGSPEAKAAAAERAQAILGMHRHISQ